MLHVVTADKTTVFILSLLQALDHSGHGQIQDEHRDEDDEDSKKGHTATTGDDGYEGNLGNLVTDALRTCAWEDTTIAFQNNGGIRSTLDIGEITGEDVFSVFPFNNTVDR